MKYKKEKYINQRLLKNGWTFQVIIRKDGYTITESFSESDFSSAKLAYDTAIAYRDRKLIEIRDKTYFKPILASLREVFELSEELSNVNYKTRRNHETMFNKFIKDISITDFDSEFVIRTLNAMTTDCSNDQIARVFSLLKQIDNTAILKHYYAVPVTLGIKPPKSNKIYQLKKSKIATIDEFKNVDDSIKGIVMVALLTGMRPAEIFALTSKDIKDGWFSVNKEVGSTIDEERTIRNTKTEGSTRLIPISPKLKPYIKRKGLLFPNKYGEYLTSNAVSSKLRKYGLNLYMCRHMFATNLDNLGVDRKTIDTLMGHCPRYSTDVYLHTNKEKMLDAIKKLEEFYNL